MKKFIKGITIALAVVLCGLLGVGAIWRTHCLIIIR